MVSLLPLLILCAAPPDADGVAILTQRCIRCHDAEKTRGGLDLSTRETALAGGATMDAIVPHDLEKSAVYSRAKDHSMPPPKDAPPLSDAEVNVLARWIEQGAPWPDQSRRAEQATRSYAMSGDARRNGALLVPPYEVCKSGVDSKSRRLRRWRRYGNVAPPLSQVALRPTRR